MDLSIRHRITILWVIFVVLVVLVISGRSVSDALGLITAAGVAAAQIGLWLSGRCPAVDAPGGVV